MYFMRVISHQQGKCQILPFFRRPKSSKIPQYVFSESHLTSARIIDVLTFSGGQILKSNSLYSLKVNSRQRGKFEILAYFSKSMSSKIPQYVFSEVISRQRGKFESLAYFSKSMSSKIRQSDSSEIPSYVFSEVISRQRIQPISVYIYIIHSSQYGMVSTYQIKTNKLYIVHINVGINYGGLF